MPDNPSIDRVLTDAAEWLMALPAPQHHHLAAAGTLLIEAAHVMQGEMALAEAVMAAPNVRQGNWRPRPGGQPDALDQLADVSRETPSPERYARREHELPPVPWHGTVLATTEDGSCPDCGFTASWYASAAGVIFCRHCRWIAAEPASASNAAEVHH